MTTAQKTAHCFLIYYLENVQRLSGSLGVRMFGTWSQLVRLAAIPMRARATREAATTGRVAGPILIEHSFGTPIFFDSISMPAQVSRMNEIRSLHQGRLMDLKMHAMNAAPG